jgi:hypothetical protein
MQRLLLCLDRRSFDSATRRVNNGGLTRLVVHRFQIGGRLRRAVALLALTAWTLSGFACPMPNHGMGAVHARDDALMPGGYIHQPGKSPGHPESDLCCELLGNAHAIAQSAATLTPEQAPAPSVGVAGLDVPSLVPQIDPTRRPIPLSNGPPGNLSQRFATFWSHAPPPDLS